jgi:C-terminal processing protease CtpA/Prc
MKATLLLPALLGLLTGWLAVPDWSLAQSGSRLGTVGLQVVPTATGELAVLQVPPGTPAAAAAMKPGDLIVQIDDFPLAGSDFAEVVSQRLWGAQGTQVVIHFLRPGEAGRKAVTLRRAAADPKLTISPALRNGPANPGAKP